MIWRKHQHDIEFFLVHPGGPFWKNKDVGAWTIPKGEFETEDPLDAARREFWEETGLHINGPFLALTPIRQRSGKLVFAFAAEADIDVGSVRSNTFTLEWPKGSGKNKSFPEIDKAGWFSLEQAVGKINPSQVALLQELRAKLQL